MNIIKYLWPVCFVILFNCQRNQDKDSYAPSLLPKAVIKTISANGGGSLYCSISGGCPLQITGENFYNKVRVLVGSYECKNVTVSQNNTTIDCIVGPGQNGVYDITVKNIDNQQSSLDPSITDPTTLQFSYASFLYLGSQESPGKVYGFAQNPTTGALITVSGSPFSISTENSTYGVTIHSNNKFIYAANVNTNTISTYSINPLTGALTAVGTPTAAGAIEPNGLAFHPALSYLYVSNYGGNSISAFQVSETGQLTAISGSPFSAGTGQKLNGLVISRDGRFLFTAASGSTSGTNGVVAYSIDQTSGALNLISGSPFLNTLGGETSNKGDGISIHPNGKWLYMGLFGSRKMAAWTIDQTTGQLTALEAPILNNSTTGYPDDGGSASTVSADGLFLYSTAYSTNSSNPKKIIIYSINQSTGGLSRSSEVDTGGGPNDIRIDTTGRFAYTCNTRNSPSISAYSINKSTGALTGLSPRDYSVSAPDAGPGIMVMQINK